MPEAATARADGIRVGLAQISPVLLDRAATLDKVETAVSAAADSGCALVAFGEAFVPGYPFWLERTDGARFDSPVQKELHAAYLEQAVQPEAGHLDGVRRLAAARGIQVVLGCVERAADRGGHSLYAALIWIDAMGRLAAVHRKLMPTYEERLAWAAGDGHGIRVCSPSGPSRRRVSPRPRRRRLLRGRSGRFLGAASRRGARGAVGR
jgi:nitrilase